MKTTFKRAALCTRNMNTPRITFKNAQKECHIIIVYIFLQIYYWKWATLNFINVHVCFSIIIKEKYHTTKYTQMKYKINTIIFQKHAYKYVSIKYSFL